MLARSKPVTVVGDFAVFDGYGSMNEYMVRGMARAGARVSPWPVQFHPEGLSEEFLGLLARSSPHIDGPVVVAGNRLGRLDCLAGPELFVRQAWETSRFPTASLHKLNRCRAVIAPTTFVANVLRASGAEVPVEVVPDGIDPDVYGYEPRSEREQLTTLIVGRNTRGKHHPEAVAAWLEAFDDDPTARLLVRSSESRGEFPAPPGDSRIQIVDNIDRQRGLASLYREADVLLALGSEGTGLPMLEAMATGLPVIALSSEGQGDVCATIPDAVLAVQPSHWVDYPEGSQGVPDVVEVSRLLRWVADHRIEAADMGRCASHWVRQHRNVWEYGPGVLSVIADHWHS